MSTKHLRKGCSLFISGCACLHVASVTSGIERAARLRHDRLDAAVELRDLTALPGNRLEALKGDRKGQYSIRINDQWESGVYQRRERRNEMCRLLQRRSSRARKHPRTFLIRITAVNRGELPATLYLLPAPLVSQYLDRLAGKREAAVVFGLTNTEGM
jgi:plasmid maintenance system killer protein